MTQPKKTIPAFDTADLYRWERRFESDAPGQSDRRLALDCPHVVSMRSQPSAYGIAVRMRFADGSEADAFFNPVVARSLAIEIMQTGHEVGWMPDIMTMGFPKIAPDQKKTI